MYSDTTQALREGASADMGNVGQFLYNTGMSMADSLVSRGVAGGLSPLLMGMGSAEDATKDALNRGADATDALATGLASGVAESAFEKLELDKLKAFQQVSGKGVKNFLGNVGKQMLNEGANSAMADVAKNVGLNALGGMLSGGVMGAGYQMVGNISGNNQVSVLEPTEQTETQPKKQTLQDLLGLWKPQKIQTTTVKTNEIINSDPQTHTAEQMRVINDYQNSTEQDIIDFAIRARDKSIAYVEPKPIAKIRDSVADYVQEKTGIDTHGNDILINRDTITHIDNEHKNSNNGKSQITDEDLSRIRWVLDNADEFAISDDVSTITRTKDGSPAPHILMRKRIDGHYYVVEAVSDGKKEKELCD